MHDGTIDWRKARHIDEIFKSHYQTGAYIILVNRYIKENYSDLREHFRLTLFEFHDVLRSMRLDIVPEPTNFIPNPTSTDLNCVN